MNKHSSCVAKLLRDYVHDPIYRGHLRMPVDASPTDHKKTKKAFLQIMRRWRKNTGFTFEVHAVQHITDKHNCHWDAVAYSNAPVKKLRAAVSEAWRRAGGLRQSLVPQDPEKIVAQCRYQAKDIDMDRKKRTRYLPTSQGMKFHWASDGFWCGRKIEDLWHELIAEWFPPAVASNRRDTCLASPDGSEDAVRTALEARYFDQALEAKHVSLLLDATAEQLSVLVEIERRLDGLPNRNAVEVLKRLPSDPGRGISPAEIAEDTGLPVDHVRHLLEKKLGNRGAVAPRRWHNGGWELDRWHNERSVDV